MTNRLKYYDTHTLYVTSGVAREEQLAKSLKEAIKKGEDRLYHETLVQFVKDKKLDIPLNGNISDNIIDLGYEPPSKLCLDDCQIKVNLIVNKNGDYYGFGYIHVSMENVYWMLLGKNPDGTERVLEYLDPNWTAPSPKKLTEEEELEKYSNMKWYEIAEEEDKYVHPTIREVLPPLIEIPGYEYDEMQYRHHQEIARRENKDPSKVPKMGYFEFSRAYARDVDPGKMPHVLCARQVPDWIPGIAFKQIFRDYASDNTTSVLVSSSKPRASATPVNNDVSEDTDDENDNEYYDTYPIVRILDSKKDSGRIVFITFDPETKDAIFALLMTRKVHIVHPRNSNLKCTLIFDHAYEKSTRKKLNSSSGGNSGSSSGLNTGKNNTERSGWNTNNTNKNNNTRDNTQDNRNDRDNRTDRNPKKDDVNKNRNVWRKEDVQKGPQQKWENNQTRKNQTRNNQKTQQQNQNSRNKTGVDRDNIDISKYNYTKKQ